MRNHKASFCHPFALTLLVSLALGGCQVEDKHQTPMPEKPYILKHDTKTVNFEFRGRTSKLPEDEKAFLLSCLQPSGPGKTSVHITLPDKGPPLVKRRIKDIIRAVLKAGVKAKQIHKSDTVPPPHGQFVTVILDTYRAIPPLCPNWSMTYGPGYDRGTTSNFGCATAINFLLMIDDPIVLFKGESAPSRDAALDSRAIADHRAGKDKGKWLKVETTSSSGSSGASGLPSSGGSQS